MLVWLLRLSRDNLCVALWEVSVWQRVHFCFCSFCAHVRVLRGIERKRGIQRKSVLSRLMSSCIRNPPFPFPLTSPFVPSCPPNSLSYAEVTMSPRKASVPPGRSGGAKVSLPPPRPCFQLFLAPSSYHPISLPPYRPTTLSPSTSASMLCRLLCCTSNSKHIPLNLRLFLP